MPILIQNESGAHPLSPIPFPSEEELEKVLMEHPELLQDDDEAEDENATTIAFVTRQLSLLEGAGRLDLLFVGSDGLPVAVEVKLGANVEARREVIGQAFDYLSALTSLTVDELDDRVGGRLREELQKFTPDDDEGFERLWRTVGANLRERNARLVVALDDAPPALERIFNFLTGAPKLDVQLLTVQQYQDKAGRIFVSRTIVDSASEPEPGSREHPQTFPELLVAFNEYNEISKDFPAQRGNAQKFRIVRIGEKPRRLSYQFTQMNRNGPIIVAFHAHGDPIKRKVGSELAEKVVEGAKLVWEPDWRSREGRLAAKFPLQTPPQTVAAAMRELISLTRPRVEDEWSKPHPS